MNNRGIIFSVHPSPEGGYEARALGHSIFTQAETIDELKRNAEEAVRLHFDEGMSRNVRLIEVLRNRMFGFAKGDFTVPDDFNDPLPKEIEDLLYD